MSSLDDPRVFFAAERTQASRVIGLGFVVARFGLFLRLVAHGPQAPDPRIGASLVIGAGMVVLGSLACALAAVQFRRFVRTLSPAEMPPRWLISLPALFAWVLAVGGLVLASILVLG